MINSSQLFRIQTDILFLLHHIRKDPGERLPAEGSLTIWFLGEED